MVSISKEFKFDAAHRLCSAALTQEEQEKTYGLCCNVHGHTYKLLVEITGEPDEDTGMLINFATLKRVVNASIIEEFDHKFINDLDWFKDKPTTAEYMIQYMWDRLEVELDDILPEGCFLSKLILWETETSFVTKVA